MATPGGEHAFDAWRATGAELGRPFVYAMLAEACAVFCVCAALGRVDERAGARPGLLARPPALHRLDKLHGAAHGGREGIVVLRLLRVFFRWRRARRTLRRERAPQRVGNLFGALITFLPALPGWVWPEPLQWLILAVIAFELQEKWQGRPPGDQQTVDGHQGNAASGQKPDHSRSPNVEVQASPDSDFLPLIRIQTGEYSMGSPGGEEGRGDHEGPQRQIRISQSFLIGQHEVTQAQFESVMQTNPSVHRGPDLPVDSVTWNEAVTFCQRLSDREGRRYRLPTEAEWEYACRAGSTTAYAWGSEWTPAAAALQTGGPGQELETPARVGSYPASSWGLFDMHGNVWEWCQDRWSENFRQSRLKPGSPGSAHDQFPVIRGGSWRDAPRNGRSASRQPLSPGTRRDDVGFRVVRDG